MMVIMSNPINTKSISRIAAIQTFYDFYNACEGNLYQESIAYTHSGDDLDEINDSRLLSSLLKIIEYYKDKDSKNDFITKGDDRVKIKPSYKFLKELVKFTHQDITYVDSLISDNLGDGWEIENLSPLLLSILRIAVCELKFYPETSTKIIISEYTDIANSLLDENDVGFVNSILDRCSNIVRGV